MTSNQEIDPNSIVARIISELENQPAVRPLLLRALLTDEFLAMPARLMRMDDNISGLKNDVAELKTDVADLKTDVAELKTDVAELKTDVADLKTDMTSVKKRSRIPQGAGPGARPGKIGPRSSDQPTGLARYAHHKGTYGRSDA